MSVFNKVTSPAVALCALTAAAIISSSVPAHAEFFNPLEFLFGRSQERVQPVEVYRRPSDAELIRAARRAAERRAERRAMSHHAAIESNGGVAFKQVPLAPQEGVAAGSVEHFAADKTLRSGDVVVTTRGFLVYHGGAYSDKSASAFTPLSASASKKQNALASLEKASTGPAQSSWVAAPLAIHTDQAQSKAVATDRPKDGVLPAAYN